MPPARFEPAVPVRERPKIYDLDRTAKEISQQLNTQFYVAINIYKATKRRLGSFTSTEPTHGINSHQRFHQQ